MLLLMMLDDVMHLSVEQPHGLSRRRVLRTPEHEAQNDPPVRAWVRY
jgi:hypothetical protein